MHIVNSKSATQKKINQTNMATVVLMMRWHAINRCKSRLSKDIGAFKAAIIQERLTNHTINVAKRIQNEGYADIKVAIDGIGIKAAKKWANLNKIKSISTQGPGNLGIKMKRQFLKTYSKKALSNKIAHPIIIIGTDLPTISQFDLIQAIEILNHKEMVLGPSNDGGYWLIGLSKQLLNPMCSWPFCGIKWGSNQVLKKTIRIADLNKIDYQILKKKNDLDHLLDLSPWLDHKKFLISALSYQL